MVIKIVKIKIIEFRFGVSMEFQNKKIVLWVVFGWLSIWVKIYMFFVNSIKYESNPTVLLMCYKSRQHVKTVEDRQVTCWITAHCVDLFDILVVMSCRKISSIIFSIHFDLFYAILENLFQPCLSVLFSLLVLLMTRVRYTVLKILNAFWFAMELFLYIYKI